MTDQITDAGGQVDTTATTQGSDAGTSTAQANTSLLGGAGAEDKPAEGAAATNGDQLADGVKQDDATKGKDGDADQANKGDDKGDAVPAEYADFTAPDGLSMDSEVMGNFKSLAKDLNLSQEKAQKVADLGTRLVQKTQEAQQQALQAEVAEWATASQNDKEFGGDKLQENLGSAKAALEQFGSPELKTMLNTSGLGNHPEVIRLLYRVSKAVSEDKLLTGKAPQGEKGLAQKMYPNMNP